MAPPRRTPPGSSPTAPGRSQDRKSTRLNSSHVQISYAVFCLKQKNDGGHGRCGNTAHEKNVGRPGLEEVAASLAELGIACEDFFFTDPATTEIYTLSLHDALPIQRPVVR